MSWILVDSSSSGPGSSDSNICRPPTRSRGSTARNSTMIPIPPSHCENWRQNTSECESASTSVTTDGARGREPGHRLEVRVDAAARADPRPRRGTAARRAPPRAARSARRRGTLRARRRGRALGSATRERARSRRRPRRTRATARPARSRAARSTNGKANARLEQLDERPDEVERRQDVDAEARSAHRARTTVGTRADSVNTITRSPGLQDVVAVREDRHARRGRSRRSARRSSAAP